MGIDFRFRDGDLPPCRFAVSPLTETGNAIRALVLPRGDAYHLGWQRHARQQLPWLAIGELASLLSLPGYQPDFLGPAPAGPFTEFGPELDAVRATPPGQVGGELARSLSTPEGQAAQRALPRLDSDPARVRDLLADQLQRAWSVLVEPWWPRLRDVLDADITFRARQLADAGLAATLDGLDRRITWRGGALRVAMAADQVIDLAGAELVLIPSVFGWPGVGVSYRPAAVEYPARGIAGLWQPPARPDGTTARLLGRTRARLLTALAEPASTTGLAARTGVPASSVSEHLAVLRAAGLIATTRTGRHQVHQRTALGIALCGPAAGE